MRFVDISHVIEDGLITYKGLPAPIICDYLSREESRSHYDGETFHIGRVHMVVNTGTYIDCPFHRYEDGRQFTDIELNKLVGLPVELIHAPYQESREIGPSFFENYDLKGKAVLVHTGWDVFWRQDAYFEYNPYLTEGAAIYLRDQGVGLVGIDSINIDDTRSKSRPVHSVLLRDDILIIEHLCKLIQIPDNQIVKLTVAPPKIKGVGSFPVRAFVEIV